MQVPSFVRRATWRVIVGGAMAAVTIAVVGLAGERVRFGADLEGARAQIERDVRCEFSSLSARLETAVEQLQRDRHDHDDQPDARHGADASAVRTPV